jgi:hypothetical protein
MLPVTVEIVDKPGARAGTGERGALEPRLGGK